LGITVKNLERVSYFASYIIKKVNTKKRDQLRQDKEAEFAAAKEAIKLRYEKEAEAEDANLKALAEAQTKEVSDVEKEWEIFKAQVTASKTSSYQRS